MAASLAARLQLAIPSLGAQEHVSLAPWTSVRVGGVAEAYVKPRSPEDVRALLRFCREEGVAFHVLGGGANTLVGDGGVPGVVIRIAPDLFAEQVQGSDDATRLTFSTGAAIVRLINQMKANKLVGAEFLAGIPGTLGGAVAMNAGTKNGECMSIVEALEVVTRDGVGWVGRDAIAYRYRHTSLPPESIVTRVCFALRPGDLADSQARMEADLGYRKRTQPLSQPNFGSVFTNPPVDNAGRLIESVGLKGHTAGRAQISPLHANWIVNLGGATARDVTTLMSLMQSRVHEASGIELHPEVKRIGVFT